jgi:hypothetical protein
VFDRLAENKAALLSQPVLIALCILYLAATLGADDPVYRYLAATVSGVLNFESGIVTLVSILLN